MRLNKQRQGPELQYDYYTPRVVLLLALLVVGGVIAYFLSLEHLRTGQRERERLAIQAKVIDENLARQLDGVYQALESIRRELPSPLATSSARPLDQRLTTLADAMPGIRTFLITDDAGTIIASNRKQVIGQNISYREYFQVPRAHRNRSTLYISPPFRTILGNFVINVALMISGPNGEFRGVVSAGLDPEYFTILLGSVLYAPDMWAALVHGDGRQFLMVPDRPGMVGLDLAKPGTFFAHHRESGQRESIQTGILSDADDAQFVALRTIRPGNVPMDKPLVVAVGRKMSALYENWNREAAGQSILFGVLVLATTLALYLYQQRQRRFDAMAANYLAELLQAKEVAVAADEAKSRFLVTVAHEFRTPLSLLTSSTDILDRYGDRLSCEQRTEQNSHIRNAARQMTSLVNSVLSITSQGGQQPEVASERLDVAQLCRVIAAETATVWGSGYDFQAVVADDCGIAVLSESLFRRVLENLLTNAFRYTPPGGMVSLNVAREGEWLHVAVADSGIGVPEQDLDRIFDPFHRGINVEGRRGLGLGLSIVRDALNQMGGAIAISSSLGNGTTMRLQIPLADRLDSEGCAPCIQS